MKETSATAKVMLILFFVTFLLSIVCLGTYVLLVAPRLNAVATATLAERTQAAVDGPNAANLNTQEAIFGMETQHVGETLTAVPTLTSSPTLIPSPTGTPTLIPTPTLTPTQSLSKCAISGGGLIYPLPSKAFAQFARTISPVITVLAQADKTGWYLVNYEKSKTGWMNIENLRFDSSCVPVSTNMEFLTGWDQDGKRVFMDDFYTTDFGWKTDEGDLTVVTNDKKTYVLPLGGSSAQQAYLKNQPFDLSGNFSLYTSFAYVRSAKYFGVRFWDDGTNYYEVRVTTNCDLEVYDGEDLLSRRPTLTQQNCYAGHQNFLSLKVMANSSGETILNATLNEAPAVDFTLPGRYEGKKFSWVWGLGTQVEVEYLVLLH